MASSRALESLALAALPVLFAVFPSGRFAVMAGFALLFHLLVALRARTQLYPLYMFGYAAPLWDLLVRAGFISLPVPQPVAMAGAALGIMLSLLFEFAVMPSSAQVVQPSGTFKPARLTVHLKRKGVSATATVDYPTSRPRKAAVKLPYLPYPIFTTSGLAKGLGVPSFLTRWFSQLKPVAYDGDPAVTPLAGDGKHGVVVFSHADGMVPEVYASLLHDLVSHGWVVFSVTHSDGSAAFSRCADGVSQFYSAPPKEPGRYREKELHARVKTRVQDLSALLDLVGVCAGIGEKRRDEQDEEQAPREPQLDEVLAAKMLQNKLDTSRLVAIGHGLGASAVATLCEADRRVMAAVLADFEPAAVTPHTFSRVAKIPTLALATDTSAFSPAAVSAMRLLVDASTRAQYVRAAAGDATGCGIADDGTVSTAIGLERADVHPASALLHVSGMKTGNLTDAAVLLGRLSQTVGVSGSTPPMAAINTVRAVLQGFLGNPTNPSWLTPAMQLKAVSKL